MKLNPDEHTKRMVELLEEAAMELRIMMRYGSFTTFRYPYTADRHRLRMLEMELSKAALLWRRQK